MLNFDRLALKSFSGKPVDAKNVLTCMLILTYYWVI